MPYLDASSFVLALPRSAGTITGSSVPLTLGEVATIIARTSAVFDGALAAAGYDVPIPTTATVAYAAAEETVWNGAAWRVLRAIYPQQGGPGDKLTSAEEYKASYEATLKAIRDGSFVLVGAAQSSGDSGRVLPRSYETSNVGATDGGASPIIGWAGMVF